MAKIAILNDSPEVVALMAHFLTQGTHEFLNRIGATEQMLEAVLAFAPELVVIPLHRRVGSIDRPITTPEADIQGLAMFRMIAGEPRLAAVPVVLFGFYVREADLPEAMRDAGRHLEFLEFPLGLQALNPLISGTVGPAEGELADVDRLRRYSQRPESRP